MSQPFPQIGSPLTDPKTGNVTPVWRSLLAALWLNQGGAQNAALAPAIGNQNQAFYVATATLSSHAVPLAQADGRYAPKAGSQTQAFYVGNAPAGTNYAMRRSQADGLFVAFAGSPAASSSITVGASPFAYTATTGGTVTVSAGTVSALTITRASTVIATGVIAGLVPVRNGDIVTVTYTAAPAMVFIPT